MSNVHTHTQKDMQTYNQGIRFDATFKQVSPNLMKTIETALVQCYNVHLPAPLIEYVTLTPNTEGIDVAGTRLPYLWKTSDCLKMFLHRLNMSCTANLWGPMRRQQVQRPLEYLEEPAPAAPPVPDSTRIAHGEATCINYNLRTADGHDLFLAGTLSQMDSISRSYADLVQVPSGTRSGAVGMQKLCIALSPDCHVDLLHEIASNICALIGQSIDCCYLRHSRPWVIFQSAVPVEFHQEYVRRIAQHCPVQWGIDDTQPVAVPLGRPSAYWSNKTTSADPPCGDDDHDKWAIIMDLEDLQQLEKLPQLEFLALWTGSHVDIPAPPNVNQLVAARLGKDTRYESRDHSLPGSSWACDCRGGQRVEPMYATFGRTLWIIQCRLCDYVSRFDYTLPPPFQRPTPPPFQRLPLPPPFQRLPLPPPPPPFR